MTKRKQYKHLFLVDKHQKRFLIKSWVHTILILSVYVISIPLIFNFVEAERRQFKLHWNASNPIFRIDNTDNVFDINKGNAPWEHDQVDIMCPYYDSSTPSDPKLDEEKYIIYNVNKEEFDSCRIHNSMPRIIAKCVHPHKKMFVTITFRSFTPTPGGLEFKPGQDYYFITTSSSNNLRNRYGGRCVSHGMKVIFKVIDNSIQPPYEPVNLKNYKKSNLKRKKYRVKQSHERSEVKFKRVLHPSDNDTSNGIKDIKILESNKHFYRGSYQKLPHKNKKYSKSFENEVLEYEAISVEASRMHHSGSPTSAKFIVQNGKTKILSIILWTIAIFISYR